MFIFFVCFPVVPLTGTVDSAITYDIETKQPNENTLKINGHDLGSKLQDCNSTSSRWKNAHYHLWKDFTTAYTDLYVLKWSFWWALATCGFLQVI